MKPLLLEHHHIRPRQISRLGPR
ncbi:hypothetical protein LINPERPRIM_LOCUS26512 [Linum perenne]